MSPFKLRAPLFDTPEASLKRDKFKFDAVIEKYIALAHGLPPSPVTSSELHTSRTPHKKQCTATGKTSKKSKAVTQPLRQSLHNGPSLSIEDDMVQEVEESLLRRKEELGLPADYVCQEVMKDDRKYYGAHGSAKRNVSHNAPTSTKRSKASSGRPRKRRRKMLEDVTNCRELASQNRTRALKRKNTEENDGLDISVLLSSPESKKEKVRKMSKGSRNMKLELNEKRAKENIDAKQLPSDKSKTPKKDINGQKSNRGRKRKNEPRETKAVGKATAGNTKKEGNAAVARNLMPTDKGKAQQEEISAKLLDAVKKALSNKIRSGAHIVHMIKEKNDIICLFDDLDSVLLSLSPQNKETPQTVKGNAGSEKTSTSSEQQSGKVPADKRINGEPKQIRSAGTKRTSKSSEQQSGKVPADEKRKEAEKEQAPEDQSVTKCVNKTKIEAKSGQVVRSHAVKEKMSTSELQSTNKRTLRQKTDSAWKSGKVPADEKRKEAEKEQASEDHSVTECVNKKKIEAKSEQVVRSHAVKEKMSTSELQSTNKRTLRQKTDSVLEEQKIRLPVNKDKKAEAEETKQHTILEKAAALARTDQLIVKLQRLKEPVNKIKRTEGKQVEQTNGMDNCLQKKANVAQHTSRITNNKTKETDKQQTVTVQDISHKGKTKDNQNTKTDHNKCQSTAACIEKKIDTQHEGTRGTTRKTKVINQPASEVHDNAPKKRELRGVVAKTSDSQKAQASVPVSECHGNSKASSKTRVSQSGATDSGVEVTDKSESAAPPSSPRNVSRSFADSSYQLAGNGLLKEKNCDYLNFSESEEEESDWSTLSNEDDSSEELNVKRRKKRRFKLFKRKRSKRPSKSTHKADDDDDDDIIILTSLNFPTQNNENNPNTANAVDKSNTHPSTPHRPLKKPSPVRNLMNKISEERKKNSFSESLSNTLLARHHRRKMETADAAYQNTEEDEGLEDTWSLLRLPPVQQSSSYLTSRARMTSHGSQHMETSSIQQQDTATSIRHSRIHTSTFVNNSTFANTTAATTMSKPSQSFWEMPTTNEEGNTTMMSESIRQRTYTTKAGLPDYHTLGPERWIAAVRKLQKKKMI